MSNVVFIIWLVINVLLMTHVLHEAILVINALRKNKKTTPEVSDDELPIVTIQLPLYNEKYVVERLLDAIRKIEYPEHLLEVQILDDSTDETTETIQSYINIHNCNFDLIRRKDRTGFKAGALAYGLEFAKGEFVAIFDADFVPSSNFLKATIPHFQDENIGVVQTRWLHINKQQSMLTRAQALMLDTHFSVEQLGRHNADGFINFNGTAGIWRKKCIKDAGGWKADTLTEDLDLSFRAQAKGWKFEYLFNVGSPAELPSTFEAYRTQQFRWSKGAAECVRKNWKMLWKSSVNFGSKVMGSFHLLNSSVYLLVVALLLLSPFVYYINTESLVTVPYHEYFLPIGPTVSGSLFLIFLTGSLLANKNKLNTILWFVPSLFTFFSMTTGISLYMSFGVIEGYWGKKSPFVRTPKFGEENITKKIKSGYDYKKEYSIKLLEIICWGYALYWCYMGIQTLNVMIIAYALILLTGFSLSLFFKKPDVPVALIRTYGSWVLVLVSTLFYVLLTYNTERTEHLELFLYFSVLVAIWLLLHRLLSNSSWIAIFAIGALFRLSIFLADPHLSDDYFRFVWDGELSKDGYSPFGFVPSEFADHVSPEHHDKYASILEDNTEYFPEGMNSKGYYSIYPTVNQFVFYTAAFDRDIYGRNLNRNLLVIRLWILLAEVGSFFLLRALLKSHDKSHWISLYWLHPLIIIELTGNLHLEALAITFILLSLFLSHKNHWVGASISLAFGVMTKLTPLILLGAFYKKYPFWKWIVMCMVTVGTSIALFSIFLDTETFANFKESVGLFFAWFSFNSGLYYGVRDLTLLITDTNISAQISLFFPFISAAIMARHVFLGKSDLINTALLLFTTYFLFTPILHPWYITILIPLGILSKKLYPLIWSVLIFATYAAYGDSFQESLWIIYLEFAIVLYLLFSEYQIRSNWVKNLTNRLFA